MSHTRTPAESRAADAAAAWRAKLDSDDATESDWLAYEAWLAAEPVNRAAAEALDEALADIQLHRAELTATSSNIAVFPGRWLRKPAVWAAAAAALAAGALLFIVTSPPSAELAFAAPSDSSRVVELADGTRVHLNRGSAIRVRYGQERQIELAQGEASFDVRHDPSRPFEVTVGETNIRDIGTEFNIARNAGSLVVTVRSGEVEVGSRGIASAHVRAGEQARVEGAGIAVASTQADDAFAWQAGHLVYHDAPLAAVVEDLNRYSDKPIVLAAQTDLRFSGILVISEPRAMLANLRSFLPIRADDEGDRIVVRSGA